MSAAAMVLAGAEAPRSPGSLLSAALAARAGLRVLERARSYAGLLALALALVRASNDDGAGDRTRS